MAGGDVKLVGSWASPYVIRVIIALNIKSIKYEFFQQKFREKSELLLRSNPVQKKIPVLIHGDKPICESLIIVEYIDEAWTSGPSILPSDPYDRAIARFWAAYLDDKLIQCPTTVVHLTDTMVNLIIGTECPDVGRRSGFTVDRTKSVTWFPALRTVRLAHTEEARQAAVETVKEGFALLEEAFVKISKGKDFFGGDQIGFIDIAFGSNLAWLKVTENSFNMKLFDEAKTPNLFKWAEKFVSDPSAKDVIPETDKLAEFAKVNFAKAKATQK